MTDVHTPEQRSFNMSQIKGKDTKPEILVRKWLWSNGYRYRLHNKNLPGKPDIVFAGRKKVIFINGCFWHGHNCRYFKWPKTNEDFWHRKISGNIARDKEIYQELLNSGWSCLIIWECELRASGISNTSASMFGIGDQIKSFLESDIDFFEINSSSS